VRVGVWLIIRRPNAIGARGAAAALIESAAIAAAVITGNVRRPIADAGIVRGDVSNVAGAGFTVCGTLRERAHADSGFLPAINYS